MSKSFAQFRPWTPVFEVIKKPERPSFLRSFHLGKKASPCHDCAELLECRSVPRSVVVLLCGDAPRGPFGENTGLDLRLRVGVPFLLEVAVTVGNIRVMLSVHVDQNLGEEQTRTTAGVAVQLGSVGSDFFVDRLEQGENFGSFVGFGELLCLVASSEELLQ